MLRKWGSVVAAAALFASSTAVFADNAQQQGALAPGDSAGVQKAEGMGSDTAMLIVGAVVFGAGLCLVLCGNNGNGTPSTTTTAAP